MLEGLTENVYGVMSSSTHRVLSTDIFERSDQILVKSCVTYVITIFSVSGSIPFDSVYISLLFYNVL